MSNAAYIKQFDESTDVLVFINDEPVLLKESTLNALKAMAYDQGKTVEQIMNDIVVETMAAPARMASVIERCKAEDEALSH